jgi:hypothetical protein
MGIAGELFVARRLQGASGRFDQSVDELLGVAAVPPIRTSGDQDPLVVPAPKLLNRDPELFRYVLDAVLGYLE